MHASARSGHETEREGEIERASVDYAISVDNQRIARQRSAFMRVLAFIEIINER